MITLFWKGTLPFLNSAHSRIYGLAATFNDTDADGYTVSFKRPVWHAAVARSLSVMKINVD